MKLFQIHEAVPYILQSNIIFAALTRVKIEIMGILTEWQTTLSPVSNTDNLKHDKARKRGTEKLISGDTLRIRRPKTR